MTYAMTTVTSGGHYRIMALPATFSGLTGKCITVLQLFVVLTSYFNETNPDTRAKYSKFSQIAGEKTGSTSTQQSVTWPSKVGMLVIYTPALLTSLLFLTTPSLILSFETHLSSPPLTLILCFIHFAKRCLEVIFLHHYSGRVDRATPSLIAFYYALIAALIAFANDTANNADVSSATRRKFIGTTLFITGILGNFYHHYLLSKLRSSSSKIQKYVAPKGGLFSYVATPHYLFELIGWFGIAIVSNHLNVYLVALGMTSYLSGRSVAQNDFNRKTFNQKDWPKERRNMIPFVF